MKEMDAINAKDFLLEFRKTRDFDLVLPLLCRNETLQHEVFQYIASPTYPFPEYSSWLGIHFFNAYPEKMSLSLCKEIIEVLLITTNHAVQRNCTAMLESAPYQLTENGNLLNKLIDFLLTNDSLTALVYHSINVIEKQFLPVFPELLIELKVIVDTWHNHSKPSFRSMARNFNKKHQNNPYYVA
jgi:hypothetical protein